MRSLRARTARSAAGWLAPFGLAAIALACVLPVAVVIVGSFSEGNPFNDFHGSLGPWTRALDSPQTLRSIGYSFLLSLRVPAALLISFVSAWYLARNDVPGKRMIMYALWLAFFLPILPATLGWILLLDPNYGIINTYAEALIDGPLVDIYSLAGITWVHLTLTTIPIMVIIIEPAQRFIDSSYEEASTMSGAGILTTLARVTVPLIAPTLLTAFVAGTIKSLEAFEVEQVLGVPSGNPCLFDANFQSSADQPAGRAAGDGAEHVLPRHSVCSRALLSLAVAAGPHGRNPDREGRAPPGASTDACILGGVGAFLRCHHHHRRAAIRDGIRQFLQRAFRVLQSRASMDNGALARRSPECGVRERAAPVAAHRDNGGGRRNAPLPRHRLVLRAQFVPREVRHVAGDLAAMGCSRACCSAPRS